MDTQYSEWYAI